MIQPQEIPFLKQILVHPGTMATVLHLIALRAFGAEIYGWEPETLLLEMEDEFQVQLPPTILSRLNAIVNSVASNAFYQDWAAFAVICEALNGDLSSIDVFDPPMPAELAWGVVEVRLNDSTPSPFNPEIAAYVGVVLNEDGHVLPPAALTWAKMPQVYRGSDYAADLHQQRLASQESNRRVDDYIRDQSLLLFKQIRSLPWMTPEKVDQMSTLLDEI